MFRRKNKEQQPKEKWVIDKEFGFDYGHRVHNQTLNQSYSIDGACVCRHLHGHRAKVHVYLEGEQLDGGFVTDFKHLNWLKHFLDDHLDHKFILDMNDPWFANIINAKPNCCTETDDNDPSYKRRILLSLAATQPLNTTNTDIIQVDPVYVPDTDVLVGYDVNPGNMKGPEREFFEGFFIVDFVPTSENLSKWVFDVAEAKMSLINVKVSRVDWWETPKSKSTYTRG